MKMRPLLPLLAVLAFIPTLRADETGGRKVYQVRYLDSPPFGVAAWEASEMVQRGDGKDSRFVPYNSDAAKKLILDATTVREISEDPSLKDHETAFYMAYDSKGWYIYIHCQEPEIERFVDEEKDIALELFFSPGMHRVPYYQMMIRQAEKRVEHIDWGMPHRHYRSLEGSVESETRALDTGYATFLFIPWDRLYDRLPLSGEHWRFSLMRWGPSVTWGGKVHDTGNFGLVRFEKPNGETRKNIRKHIARRAWAKFNLEAKKATAFWSDEAVGDLDFYNQKLKPVIEKHQALYKSLGPRENWDGAALDKVEAASGDWMEFGYQVSELRSEFLLDRHFP